MTGLVYLLQPGYCEGTNRYKIGMSRDQTFKRVIRGYPKNTSVYCINGSLVNPVEVERALIHQFDESFVKSACGHEYYEGNIKYMIDIFQDIVQKTGIIQTTQNKEEEKDIFKKFLNDNFIRTSNPDDVIIFHEMYAAFRMWYNNTYNNTKNMPSNNALRTFMDKIVEHNHKGYVNIANKSVGWTL